MILVDTSVWVDHFRRRNDRLASLLLDGLVLCHPFVVGELACGNLRRRAEILGYLTDLPEIPVAEDREVLDLVERRKLMGTGIGWIDAHLLAGVILAGETIWTLDRPLRRAAAALRVSATVASADDS